jgi:hypothetical protein
MKPKQVKRKPRKPPKAFIGSAVFEIYKHPPVFVVIDAGSLPSGSVRTAISWLTKAADWMEWKEKEGKR